MTETVPSRGNPLRPLRASNLIVDLVELAGVVRKFVKCPRCGRFAQVKRSQLAAHTTPEGARCANSRRNLINDLDEADWACGYDSAARLIERFRRPSRVHYRPSPAIPAPLHRIRPA